MGLPQKPGSDTLKAGAAALTGAPVSLKRGAWGANSTKAAIAKMEKAAEMVSCLLTSKLLVRLISCASAILQRSNSLEMSRNGRLAGPGSHATYDLMVKEVLP